MTVPNALPDNHYVLSCDVRPEIPGFESQSAPSARVLAPSDCDCREWYRSFVRRVIQAQTDGEHLPVCRIGDGENAGDARMATSRPTSRCGRTTKIALRELLAAVTHPGRVRAATLPTVSSGEYSLRELRENREEYWALLRQVSKTGVLGMRLSFGDNPSVERYFPSLRRSLVEHGITLTYENYVPNYFVYALLSSEIFASELIRNRSIVVVHGASGQKRQDIKHRLESIGASVVHWVSISTSRSMFDLVDSVTIQGLNPDLVLLGAGVGKPWIFQQLSMIGSPILDAGYMFEVWADPQLGAKRPYCMPDTS